MIHTAFCERFGIEHPVGNAGMAGGAAGPALAAAVSEAGGLGGLGGIDRRGPEYLRGLIREVRERTQRPFSVNLWAFVLEGGGVRFLDVCIEERVPSVTLSFGDATPYVAAVQGAGVRVLYQTQTVEGARRAAAAGVDAIIAQGGEAGGHTGAVATMPLVPACVDVAGDIPVLAAGGIADGRGLAAALALGAQGAILGTRFVCAVEATPSAAQHRERIVAATADDTLYTDVFDIIDGLRWPDGISGRTIRTEFAAAWHGREDDLRREREHILASSPAPGEAPPEAHSAYAGQSAGLVHDVRPAGEIVRSIVIEAEREIARLSQLRR
jgi:nitronate monooxygenase